MTTRVRSELYAASPDKKTAEVRSTRYVNIEKLRRLERRSLQRESDWTNEDYERYSDDNGRTWGPWKNVFDKVHETKGEDEVVTWDGANWNQAYNPRYGHFVSVSMRTIFFGGHVKAYERHWGGQLGYVNHCLLEVRPNGSEERSSQLVKYEPGADYDPVNWRDPSYVENNDACFGSWMTGRIIWKLGDCIC